MTPSTVVWAVPAFTRGEVDRAGRLLAQNGVADPLAIGHALDVINNWRSSHSFPLNTFQMTLRNRAASICGDPIVARRLKRVPSVFAKLRRFPTMKLSQMQDIGGARAVLPSLTEIEALRDLYRQRTRHRFAGEKDYVRHPKASGYRSIHLVYRYRSDRKETYNGLHIELQLRTRRQHAWATAVETVGTFLGQSLKSSEGRADWLRFFELVGSGFALAEGAPAGPNAPESTASLVAEIRGAARRSWSVQVEPQAAGRRLHAVAVRHLTAAPGQRNDGRDPRLARRGESPRTTGGPRRLSMRALPALTAVAAVAAVTAALLAAAPPALAHHSFAAQFDANRPVTLEGTVTKVEWQNPHIWVYLDVAGPDGEVVAWECEGDNPNTLTRRGWTSASVEVGKPITIYGYQARTGSSICNGRTWVFGGRTVFAAANDGGPPAAPPEQR